MVMSVVVVAFIIDLIRVPELVVYIYRKLTAKTMLETKNIPPPRCSYEILSSLVPRAGEAKSRAANYVVALYIRAYMNRKNRVSSPICVVFHRYGFTRIFGGTTSGTTTLIDRFGREFSLLLIHGG